MKFFLVQALFNSRYGGVRHGKHHIVTGADPVGAAKSYIDELRPAKDKLPVKFRVWPLRTPESFKEDVGQLKLVDEFDEDSETSYQAVADMFDPVHTEVQL